MSMEISQSPRRGLLACLRQVTLRRTHATQSRRPSSRPSLHRLLTTTATTTPPSPPPPEAGITPLPQRRLLSIHGPDASGFLHGLSTATFPSNDIAAPGAFYNAFLNAQGRILSEGFVWRVGGLASFSRWLASTAVDAGQVAKRKGVWQDGDPAFLVEIDADLVGELSRHLRRHRLRARLEMRLVEEGEWAVLAAWTRLDDPLEGYRQTGVDGVHMGSKPLSEQIERQTQKRDSQLLVSVRDTRAPGLGQRLLVGTHSANTSPISIVSEQSKLFSSLPIASDQVYTIRRHLAGVPEGPSELLSGSALPQESNLDLSGALDFRKGCYVGQELTIRTHHTGVVRKRIVPCTLQSPAHQNATLAAMRFSTDQLPAVPHGTEIRKVAAPGDAKAMARPRPAGKWVGGTGNVGLALARLEMMTDIRITDEGAAGGWRSGDEFALRLDRSAGTSESVETGGDVRVRAYIPQWWRDRLRARRMTREK